MTGYRGDVKAGDTILVWSYSEWKERTVKRVTKTMVVIGNAYETRFRKSDGYEVGSDGYSRARFQAVTEEELQTHRERMNKEEELRGLRTEVRNKMRELPRYQNMTREQCEALLEAVAKIKGE